MKPPSSAPALEQAIETFIQGAGIVSAGLLGMVNKVGGQIYAILFLSQTPLSLDEIAERLQISKGNVSINVRMLEEFDLVRKIWVKGSRKDYYTAQMTYPKKVIRDFLAKIQRNIEEARSTIQQTRRQIEQIKPATADEQEKVEYILRQLNVIGTFYAAAATFFANFYAGKPLNLDPIRQVLE